MSQKPNSTKERVLFIAIIVVAVLLILSISLLIAVKVRDSSDIPVSSDNVIGISGKADLPVVRLGDFSLSNQYFDSSATAVFLTSTNEDKLTLSWWTGYGAKKSFTATNLMPGDVVSQQFTVTEKNNRAQSMRFDIKNITEKSSVSSGANVKLADILNVTVAVGEKALYNGPFSQAQDIRCDLLPGASPQSVTYSITVSMPKSAGNEYAYKSLTADFSWTLEELPYPSPGENYFPEYDETTHVPDTEPIAPPDTEPIDPPDTEPIEPPDTEPIDPPDTEPIEPPDTEPIDPPDTEPIEPPITVDEHEDCCSCIICHGLAGLFGIHNETCFTCNIITAISGSEEFVCLCPIDCLFLLIVVIALAAVVIRILWVKRKVKQITKNQE